MDPEPTLTKTDTPGDRARRRIGSGAGFRVGRGGGRDPAPARWKAESDHAIPRARNPLRFLVRFLAMIRGQPWPGETVAQPSPRRLMASQAARASASLRPVNRAR